MCGEVPIIEDVGAVILQRLWAIATVMMLSGGAMSTGVERARKVYEKEITDKKWG